MTVIVRRIASTPTRTASQTWACISNLLAAGQSSALEELRAISGIAAALIVSEAPANDPIVVWGVGPRIRIYAVFGDDAVTGEDVDEGPFVSSPTNGDWRMSLPCPKDDLHWVQNELKRHSEHIEARCLGDAVEESESSAETRDNLVAKVNKDAFLRP